MTTSDYGFATVTFKKGDATRDVRVDFALQVTADELDGLELAWDASSLWPEAGWGTDNPAWGVVNVTITIDGVTTVAEPFASRER